MSSVVVHVVKPVDKHDADHCQNGNNKRQQGAISNNCLVFIELADLPGSQKRGRAIAALPEEVNRDADLWVGFRMFQHKISITYAI